MRKVLTILAVLAVVVAIGVGVVQWQQRPNDPEAPVPAEQEAPPQAAPEQPDWCPEVEVIAAPGTWESGAEDDPIHPHVNPLSFLLTVTTPLQERYPQDRVKVWTLPYTAQFRNINAPGEMTYDDSRTQGTDRVRAEMVETHRQCPGTDFVLTGFSQGAVLLGDLAEELGGPEPVVPPERVRGMALVADGRRVPEQGVPVGNPVSGVGAEVALQPLNAVVQPIVPGATMRGPRSGFGALNDKVYQVCAPDDHICDAPRDVGNALGRARDMIAASGVHAQYGTNPSVFPGTTTNQWLVEWASGLIDAPPAPA
ncbi:MULTISPECIES: cutinase family protein [unclassified Corynebacterium]|uniref:cutinase family protein n=1 Tax=unclassified Corynebacterium TaxID=2624378 RepID=UPI0029CA2170|nr:MULTISPECIES: cutinase family protein [unclassified Corynebacterium]WPF66017.1 cutinase family protein [Corynebacterium sp. 22KM0430]WPF68510.1 cutinase family protein [Corynebacterium sp. 21KM1197]